MWFEGGGEQSQSFTYTQARRPTNRVLILAAEDYSGHSPDYAEPAAAPNYLSYYQQALQANGIGYDVYDVDARDRTAPDPLGVLSHYKAIVWYTGDNVRDRSSPTSRRRAPARRSSPDDEFRAVRDYLNEGGKLLYTGKNAGWDLSTSSCYNPQGSRRTADDRRSGRRRPARASRCRTTSSSTGWGRTQQHAAADDEDGATRRLAFKNVGDPFGPRPRSAQRRRLARTTRTTSTRSSPTSSTSCRPTEYPQFKSTRPATTRSTAPLFDPPTGDYYMYSQAGDEAYKRLTQDGRPDRRDSRGR